MAEIVNLREWRKREARSDAEDKAAQNRAKFGQSKADKVLQESSKAKDARHLDQHHLRNAPDDCG